MRHDPNPETPPSFCMAAVFFAKAACSSSRGILACRPKDGLTKPAESEEQKQRNHELKRVKGKPRQCIPESSNESEQDRHGSDASAQGFTPASDTSNRQDNSSRFDTFHETCQRLATNDGTECAQ
jgi:hypothetical protein